MNCLTMAVYAWIRSDFKGRLIILKWGRPFPHFGILRQNRLLHWKAADNNLPWWRQLHFQGRYQRVWCGPK